MVYADPPEGDTLAVFGLGPVGQFAARIGKHWNRRVIGVDVVPERREMAARHGIEVIDPSGLESGSDIADALRDLTDGRGTDAVVDAVGMEVHGSPVARAAQNLAGLLPHVAARKVFEKVGVDGLTVLHAALDAVRRGGTVSVAGVYGGAVNPMPMMDMFDKQIQLRMGQCNVRRWTDVLLLLVEDAADPLGVMDVVTHTVPIAEAPGMYKTFQQKTDGCIKVVIKP